MLPDSTGRRTNCGRGRVAGACRPRRRVVLWASVLFFAASAVSPSPSTSADCFDCVLGIFDDAAMTSNRGTMTPGVPKDIYVGIQYGAGFSELTGLEFSIAGIRQVPDGILLIGTEPIVPTPVILGMVPAPEDTSSTSTGTGGLSMAWTVCLQGNQPLLRLTLLTFAPISNHVIEVKRRYPPANPAYRTPLFTQCNIPSYTKVRVTGGCYGINVPAGPLPCDVVVGVERTTWSRVKALYDE